jgi:hypothetical protein
VPLATSCPPALPWGHPDAVLHRAVTEGVVTGYEAELIARTRLERIALNDLAAVWKIPASTLAADRAAGEDRLVAYLRGGSIPATAATRPAAGPAPGHRRPRHLA